MRFVFPLLLAALLGPPSALAAPPARAGQEAGLRVLVTIRPLHGLVAAIMAGAGGSPHLLIEGARSPHGLALRPSERRRLDAAALIIWVGPELEAGLAKLLSRPALRRKSLKVTAIEGLTLLHRPKGGRAIDPHVWLDPANARRIGQAVARRLARLQPAQAALFLANARRLSATLRALERRLAARMAPLRGRPYLVFHDGFRYFEHRFGLKALGAVMSTPEKHPGARHLARLRRMIRQRGVRCVFVEPQYSAQLAKALVRGTQARIATLDALGTDIPPGPALYPRLLERLADGFAQCLAEGAGR